MVGNLAVQEIAVGGAIAAIGAIFSVRLEGGSAMMHGSLFQPRRAIAFLFYVPWFMGQIVLSNWDVAKRVISPSLPIKPGLVRVKTRLKSPLGRMVLANSITLTPGTLTVDVEGDELCIHWIDVASSDVDAATQAIVSAFEKRLEVIFG